jgi:hypothetical protein
MPDSKGVYSQEEIQKEYERIENELKEMARRGASTKDLADARTSMTSRVQGMIKSNAAIQSGTVGLPPNIAAAEMVRQQIRAAQELGAREKSLVPSGTMRGQAPTVPSVQPTKVKRYIVRVSSAWRDAQVRAGKNPDEEIRKRVPAGAQFSVQSI